MSTQTTIRSLTVHTLDIPLWESFGIAGGAQEVANNLLVTLELADGTRGYGEAAPLPPFNGETQASTRAALAAVETTLMGADAREWRGIAGQLKRLIPAAGAARCALETALLDALALHDAVPLWTFFGDTLTPLETDMTITTHEHYSGEQAVAHAAEAARGILSRGIRSIKVKIGSHDVGVDAARITAIHAAAPDALLLLDGNQGLTADTALALLQSLEQRGIVPLLFEQPVAKDDLAGMRAITLRGGVPVAADESACNLDSVRRLVEQQAANVVNIKLMKCGIAEALDIVTYCHAHHIALMIGGMVESILAMTVSACFAGGLGGFQFVDLDTPLFMTTQPLKGGMIYQQGHLNLNSIAAGHGVEPE